MAFDVLIVDENEVVAESVASVLKADGLKTRIATSIPQAAELFAGGSIKVIVLDLLFAEKGAFALLSGMIGALPETRVIVATASGSMKQAEMAMQAGAFDFIVRPYDKRKLSTVVANAMRGNLRYDASPKDGEGSLYRIFFDDMIDRINWVGASTASILIDGEAGTGKEIVGHWLHTKLFDGDQLFEIARIDPKANISFADLFSTEMREKGGTLFIDDVCDLSFSAQTQLLRYLQSTCLDAECKEILTPLVRIVCSTKKSIMEAVTKGHFREDLFYRLKVVSISLKPFRDMGAKKADFAKQMLLEKSGEKSKTFEELSETARSVVLQYSWPQNGDEMCKVITDLVDRHDAQIADLDMFPQYFLDRFAQEMETNLVSEQKCTKKAERAGGPKGGDRYQVGVKTLIESGKPLAEIERHIIEEAIAHCGGSIPKAAAKLCVSPSTIYRKKDAWVS